VLRCLSEWFIHWDDFFYGHLQSQLKLGMYVPEWELNLLPELAIDHIVS
jgi:hypothetical protein